MLASTGGQKIYNRFRMLFSVGGFCQCNSVIGREGGGGCTHFLLARRSRGCIVDYHLNFLSDFFRP